MHHQSLAQHPDSHFFPEKRPLGARARVLRAHRVNVFFVVMQVCQVMHR